MKKKLIRFFNLFLIIFIILIFLPENNNKYQTFDFNLNWKFCKTNDSAAYFINYDDSKWQNIDLPHDWSIYGPFSDTNSSTCNQGALPTGIGWYRKYFNIKYNPEKNIVYVRFDGIFKNSSVWVNENFCGNRPSGYASFYYDITKFLNKNGKNNLIAVKVDNTLQPNSRWYTGSGIYRNTYLIKKSKIHIIPWGVYVYAKEINKNFANIIAEAEVRNCFDTKKEFNIEYLILTSNGKLISKIKEKLSLLPGLNKVTSPKINIENPLLWSPETPHLYKLKINIFLNNKLYDESDENFGIRYFKFDADSGFYLNDKKYKLLGVCLHHDYGCLGAAVYKSAIKRQLTILKEMGCNAIRTAHNPPAPELLDLCDEMGFFVIDEAFDVWRKKKVKYDDHIFFNDWHEKDLSDFIKRDRNHPSIILWSIGNEIREQFDSSGIYITRKLTDIVRKYDHSRPITCALTENQPDKNFIYQSHVLDVLGFNYKHKDYNLLKKWYPNKPLFSSECVSAISSRGCYKMPSDSTFVLYHYPELNSNYKVNDYSVSAYDHVYAYWGSTHHETWRIVKSLNHIAGLFIWSGFDYLGEPFPFKYPARSSYFGILDLAGLPKDIYYFYQSEWTDKPVLHVFPHWNWEKAQVIDVWAYYNNADEAELFVNGISKGIKTKNDSLLYVLWRVNYEPGYIKVITRKNGKTTLEKKIFTSDKPYSIRLFPDKNVLHANNYDLSFIKVEIVDKNGYLVPNACVKVDFEIKGKGQIVGVDNGYQAYTKSLKSNCCYTYNGMCIVVVKSTFSKGNIYLTAKANGLIPSTIKFKVTSKNN